MRFQREVSERRRRISVAIGRRWRCVDERRERAPQVRDAGALDDTITGTGAEVESPEAELEIGLERRVAGDASGGRRDRDLRPIATPIGVLPIAALRVGDEVYSVDRGRVIAVPIVSVRRTSVSKHRMVRLTLAGKGVLEACASHPTADGRSLGQVRAGDLLDGVRVTAVSLIPYEHDATYDILPGSDSGAYFAGGVLIGRRSVKHRCWCSPRPPRLRNDSGPAQRDRSVGWLVAIIPAMNADDRADDPVFFDPGVHFRFPLALIAGNRRSLEEALRRNVELARAVAAGEVVVDHGDAASLVSLARQLAA